MGIRNRIGWQQWLGRLQGSPIDLDLLAYEAPLLEINELEAGVTDLSDDDARGAGAGSSSPRSRG